MNWLLVRRFSMMPVCTLRPVAENQGPLLVTGQIEKALGIEAAQISGVQPAFGVKDFRSLRQVHSKGPA